MHRVELGNALIIAELIAPPPTHVINAVFIQRAEELPAVCIRARELDGEGRFLKRFRRGIARSGGGSRDRAEVGLIVCREDHTGLFDGYLGSQL